MEGQVSKGHCLDCAFLRESRRTEGTHGALVTQWTERASHSSENDYFNFRGKFAVTKEQMSKLLPILKIPDSGQFIPRHFLNSKSHVTL